MPPLLGERPDAVRISLRVKPRASRTKVLGVKDDVLELAVSAAPVDGAANEEVRALVAGLLGVPKRDVVLVSGATSRSKIVEVTGVAMADVARILAAV
jgi:uncharacterized protein